MKNDELLSKYIEVRDKLSALKAKHKEEESKYQQVLDKIELKFLDQFNSSGVDSINIRGVGCAYRATRTTFSVADRDAFMGYCLNNDALHLLESRVAKKAAEEYMESTGEPPPGTNVSRSMYVNINRG